MFLLMNNMIDCLKKISANRKAVKSISYRLRVCEGEAGHVIVCAVPSEEKEA